MSLHKQKVLIMAGGTGGHIFPALSIAKKMQEKGVEIIWLGSYGGMEQKIVTDAGIKILTIKSKPIRGGSKNLLLAPFSVSASLFSALKIIKQENIDLAFGFGGFASFAGGIAAWLCKKPLFIHEQNSIMGLTNRLLAKFAQKVFLAYPLDISEKKPKHKATNFIKSANPVRADISRLALVPKRFDKNSQNINILAFGGSLGALAINQVLPKAMEILAKKLATNGHKSQQEAEQKPIKINLVHQTGKGKLTATKAEYSALNANLNLELVEFIEDMPTRLALADICISRAGALTLAELSCAQTPSILVPYPHAVDNHQFYNAKYLADANAAILLEQKNLTPEKLSAILLELIENPDKKQKLATNILKEAKPNITEEIAKQITKSLCVF